MRGSPGPAAASHRTWSSVMIKIPVGLYFSLASLWRSCHNQKYDHDGWYNGPKYVYKICTVSVIGYYYKRNLTVSESGGYLIGKSDVSEQNDAFEVYYTVMTLDNGVIILTADIEAFDYGKNFWPTIISIVKIIRFCEKPSIINFTKFQDDRFELSRHL